MLRLPLQLITPLIGGGFWLRSLHLQDQPEFFVQIRRNVKRSGWSKLPAQALQSPTVLMLAAPVALHRDLYHSACHVPHTKKKIQQVAGTKTEVHRTVQYYKYGQVCPLQPKNYKIIISYYFRISRFCCPRSLIHLDGLPIDDSP